MSDTPENLPDPDVTIPVSKPAGSLPRQDAPDLPLPEELTALLPGGNYQVEGFLGQGGMGAVYKGMQIRLKRPVAIKIMRRDQGRDYGFEQRFEREAQAMAKLNHPNIVSVIDYGEAGPDYLYIVMELVNGADLMDVIRTGRMTQEMALTLLPQICDALQFAHDHGIVHRDIKPSNIMLTRDGRVKMADFGLAKPMDAVESGFRTQTGTGMGTPDYAAPEQFDAHAHIDHRADIYALGVMIYQMITGQLPRGVWKPPSQRAEVAPEWDEVVSRAMQSDPKDRYQTASEVKTDVSQITPKSSADIPVRTPNPTPQSGANQAADRNVRATSRTRAPLLFGIITATIILAIGAFFAFRPVGDDVRSPAPVGDEVTSLTSKTAANSTEPKTSEQPGLVTSSPTMREPLPESGWKSLFTEKEWKKTGEKGREFKDGLLHLQRGSTFKTQPPLPIQAIRTRIHIRSTQAGQGALVVSEANGEGGYKLGLGPPGGYLSYHASSDPATNTLGKFALSTPLKTGDTLLLELRIRGAHLTGLVNGEVVVEAQHDGIKTLGECGIGANDGWFESVEVQSLSAPRPSPWQPLFTEAEWKKTGEKGRDFKDGLLHLQGGLAFKPQTSADGAIRGMARVMEGMDETSVFVRKGKGNSGYKLSFRPQQGDLQLTMDMGSGATILGKKTLPTALKTSGTVLLELRVMGRHLTALLDGIVMVEADDDQFTEPGEWGVLSKSGWFESVEVQTLAPALATVSPSPPLPVSKSSSANPIQTFGGHRYQFVPGALRWTDAKAKAEEMGAHLVTITSKEEAAWINTTFQSRFTIVAGASRTWIGAFADTTQRSWQWVTHEPFNFADWADGMPESGYISDPKQRYAAGIYSRTLKWSVKTQSDTSSAGFLVEWDDAGSAPSTFPPGQWVKVFTKPEDLPASVRQIEGGWFNLGSGLLHLPASLAGNYAIRARIRRGEGEAMAIVTRADKEESGHYYQFRLGPNSLGCQRRDLRNGIASYAAALPSLPVAAPLSGKEYVMEVGMVGSTLVARMDSAYCVAGKDTAHPRGPAHLRGPEDVRDIEVINLDGLPEAEALRLLGVDEKGNDLRGKADASGSTTATQKLVWRDAFLEPPLKAAIAKISRASDGYPLTAASHWRLPTTPMQAGALRLRIVTKAGSMTGFGINNGKETCTVNLNKGMWNIWRATYGQGGEGIRIAEVPLDETLSLDDGKPHEVLFAFTVDRLQATIDGKPIIGAKNPLVGPSQLVITGNGVTAIQSAEYLNLDGLPEAETMRLLGVDEKGNDLRGKAGASAAAGPWLDAMSDPSQLTLGSKVERTPEGLSFTGIGSAVRPSTQGPRRDGAVRIRAPFGSLGPKLSARQNNKGDKHMLYAADTRRLALVRWDEAAKKGTVLREFPLPEPLKPGHDYEMELRIVGQTLTAKLNGELLGTASDGTLSEGIFGVLVGQGQGYPVLVKTLEVLDLDKAVSPSPNLPVSKSPSAFPPGQWVKLFTKPEDLPADLRKPDSGVTWEDGWIRFGQKQRVVKIPNSDAANFAVRARFLRGPTREWNKIVLRGSNGKTPHYQIGYSDRLVVQKWIQTGECNTLGNIDVPALAPGATYQLEFVAIGNRLIGRLGDSILKMARDDSLKRGEAHIYGAEDLRDIEVMNLDGLPEAEALRLLGVDEQGNDLRGKAASGSPSPSPQVSSSPSSATKDAPFINTLGMKFVPVPITGGPTDGQRVLFSIWETRVQDYEVFVEETKLKWDRPSKEQGLAPIERGPTHPADNINWHNARAFCDWLTVRERNLGNLAKNEVYRLPTDHEWSCAVGIGGIEDPAKLPLEKRLKTPGYPWGAKWPPPAGAGNFPGEELSDPISKEKFHPDAPISGYRDPFEMTAPVGSFPPNAFGLFDLGGNVGEWCGDHPENPVLRGGSWIGTGTEMSSDRHAQPPERNWRGNGFRCVLASITTPVPTSSSAEPRRLVPPAPAITPTSSPAPKTPGETDKWLAEMDVFYQTKWKNEVAEPYESGFDDLKKRILFKLDREINAASHTTKLQDEIALRNERQRIESDTGAPAADSDDPPEALKAHRNDWRSHSSRLETERRKNAQTIFVQYDQVLATKQITLTQSQRPDEARQLQQRRNTLKKEWLTPPPKRATPATATKDAPSPTPSA